jgi:ribosomal protein S18 acetylase RimI-like enzyme
MTAPDDSIHIPGLPGYNFRTFQGDDDFLGMLDIFRESDQADGVSGTISLDDVRGWYAPTPRFNPSKNLFFVFEMGQSAGRMLGFSRASWYTGLDDIRLYSTSSFMRPGSRDPELWSALVQLSEQRLQEVAASHPSAPRRFFQGWATQSQVEWIAVLEREGYQAVRHFNNMLYQIADVPQKPMPVGLVMRSVQPEHMRSIWEAQREVVLGLFEVVKENWTDESYERWLTNPSHTPELWRVAWDGDQVAGMVLGRIDDSENKQLGRKRGYTEHIFVPQPWRNRGLAAALLASSLQVLKDNGMEEAELGVDSENESGAFGFYQRMGYKTYSIDIWFRKPME